MMIWIQQQHHKLKVANTSMLNCLHSFNYSTFLFCFCAVSTDGIFTMTVGGSSGLSNFGKLKSKSSSADIPSARMKPGLAISKGSLYLYGGEYENGSKQYTLNDFYALGRSHSIRVDLKCQWNKVKNAFFLVEFCRFA